MSGGLADVSGALPKALRKRLVGCRVVMPLYSTIKPELREKMTFIGGITVPVSWRRQYCGIFEAHMDGVIYYLIDNEYYFKRDMLYGHYDDAEYIDLFGYPFCRGRIMKRLETDYGQYDAPADVFWATGACLMVRSEAYRRMGGLDSRFFAHMEEIDLCWRMQLEGWKINVVPSSVVYHVGGGTLPAESPFKLFLNYRNNLLMLSNNLAKTYALEGYRKGMEIKKAAGYGERRAARRIVIRKCLDGMSAAVYLLSLRTDCFMSVFKAHKEYGQMKRQSSRTEIEEYLHRSGETAGVCGIYRKWIVLYSMLKGGKVFGSIREKDFYKI